MMRFKVPPIHADEEIEVEIVGKGKQGDGVAKHEDFIIFVPGTDVGDRLKVKITKVLPNFAFGEPVGKVTKSKKPVEPAPAEPEPPKSEPEPPKPEEAPKPEKPPAEAPAEPEAKPEEEKPKEK
jgi:predicted RNA-binding protein with TRAM domain